MEQPLDNEPGSLLQHSSVLSEAGPSSLETSEAGIHEYENVPSVNNNYIDRARCTAMRPGAMQPSSGNLSLSTSVAEVTPIAPNSSLRSPDQSFQSPASNTGQPLDKDCSSLQSEAGTSEAGPHGLMTSVISCLFCDHISEFKEFKEHIVREHNILKNEEILLSLARNCVVSESSITWPPGEIQRREESI